MLKTAIRLVAALFLLSSGSAHAKALILTADGDINPAAEVFSEAVSGDRFQLAANAEITLLHYGACQEVRFRGGVVSVSHDGLTTTGERVEVTKVPCPRKVRFKENADAVAAVVLRDLSTAVKINTRPVFALLRDKVFLVEIVQNDVVIGRIRVEGRSARWPASAPPLTPGGRYIVSLLESDRRSSIVATVAADIGITIVQP